MEAFIYNTTSRETSSVLDSRWPQLRHVEITTLSMGNVSLSAVYFIVHTITMQRLNAIDQGHFEQRIWALKSDEHS